MYIYRSYLPTKIADSETLLGEISVHSFRSAGGDREGGDEVYESQLRELGGKLLSVWEKLLNDRCEAWELSLSIMYLSWCLIMRECIDNGKPQAQCTLN